MNLRNLFPARETTPPAELLLAVEIHESLIKTAVWQRAGDDISVYSIGTFESWDSEESLVNGIDLSLTSATKDIENSPDQVVFGLPDSWLDDEGKIHPSKTNLIKRIIKDLGLKPLGLLTTSQAIIQEIKNEEGIPPTAVLLEVYFSKVVVSVIRLGETQASEEVGRSGDLARDVEEGLTRINLDKLPARFILTNGSNLDEEQQQITAYPWSEKLPFLHMPKVEVLPIDFSIKAVALIGGKEASKSNLDQSIVEEHQPVSPDDSLIVSSPEHNESLESLGFSIEADIPNQPIEENNQESVDENIFVPENPPIIEDIPSDQEQFIQPEVPAPKKPKFSIPKPNLEISIPKISLPQFHFTFPKFVKPKFGFIIIPPIVIIALLIGGYFIFAEAKVFVYVAPKSIEQTLDVDVTGEKKILSATASDSIATTGEAVVGDKATGKITIYNRSYQTVSLKTGTKVVAGNLEFTLNEAVKIASATADPNPPFTITPGNAAGLDVTAVRIGAESNVSKTTQFVVDNQAKSILVAVADVDFSGGNSKTVKAASKADQDKLLASVIEKVKNDISNQVSDQNPDLVTVPLQDFSPSKKTFDKNIGEEAATLNLELTGQQEVLVYSKESMMSKVNQQLQSQIPEDQVLSSDKTEINLETPTLSDGSYKSKAKIKGVLVPKVNTDNIVNQTKGKSIDNLKSNVKNIIGYQSTRVEVSPNIPLLSEMMPLNPQKIQISIVAR